MAQRQEQRLWSELRPLGMWHSACFPARVSHPSNGAGPRYVMKSMGEFNGKHCQAPNTQGALTKERFPAWCPYLILFTLLGKPGEGVGAIIYNPWLAGEEAGAPCQPDNVWKWWRDFNVSLLKGVSLFCNSQVIPFAVCAGLVTSLLFLLAACHLALSLLISTSTTVQQGKSKRVSLS